ncbi:methylenetetrahydrofolate reductase C-terminal domain-containing protein [Microbulbifer sp.]|uniref:methylenetetrahydrofolate reductase C-terminal domain-containing protein n=1 Tax=Microbulbifer sp. TaxID=1908541 RepID=UPI003F31A0BE
MYRVRRWSTRHAALLERFYAGFEALLVSLHPLFEKLGVQRIDAAVCAVEKVVKGFLFDTQMCGSCTLGSTGMTCPMNCPKKMRNGPCGGVRQNGNCEVRPEMPCVWLDAYTGSRQIDAGVRILQIQDPLDHRLENTSSWLRAVRRKISGGRDGQ